MVNIKDLTERKHVLGIKDILSSSTIKKDIPGFKRLTDQQYDLLEFNFQDVKDDELTDEFFDKIFSVDEYEIEREFFLTNDFGELEDYNPAVIKMPTTLTLEEITNRYKDFDAEYLNKKLNVSIISIRYILESHGDQLTEELFETLVNYSSIMGEPEDETRFNYANNLTDNAININRFIATIFVENFNTFKKLDKDFLKLNLFATLVSTKDINQNTFMSKADDDIVSKDMKDYFSSISLLDLLGFKDKVNENFHHEILNRYYDHFKDNLNEQERYELSTILNISE